MTTQMTSRMTARFLIVEIVHHHRSTKEQQSAYPTGEWQGGLQATLTVRLRQPPEGCIFHSDRGSQYCSYDYQKKLQAYGLRPSMSGKGNCYDNASVETFFKSLKAELIWRQSWPTRRQAQAAIFQYINGFYNTRRRHSYLGGISPLAFEAKVA